VLLMHGTLFLSYNQCGWSEIQALFVSSGIGRRPCGDHAGRDHQEPERNSLNAGSLCTCIHSKGKHAIPLVATENSNSWSIDISSMFTICWVLWQVLPYRVHSLPLPVA
jgi:hypothetical protein